jgi:hypothetical protein
MNESKIKELKKTDSKIIENKKDEYILKINEKKDENILLKMNEDEELLNKKINEKLQEISELEIKELIINQRYEGIFYFYFNLKIKKKGI